MLSCVFGCVRAALEQHLAERRLAKSAGGLRSAVKAVAGSTAKVQRAANLFKSATKKPAAAPPDGGPTRAP